MYCILLSNRQRLMVTLGPQLRKVSSIELHSISKCLSSMFTNIYFTIAMVLCCHKKCLNFLWYFDGNSSVIICSQFIFKTSITERSILDVAAVLDLPLVTLLLFWLLVILFSHSQYQFFHSQYSVIHLQYSFIHSWYSSVHSSVHSWYSFVHSQYSSVHSQYSQYYLSVFL